MSPPLDPGAFFAELEKIGEGKVRTRLATGRIYGDKKRPLVEEWLRRKDQEREDSLKPEEIDTARVARAAKIAANTTKIALAIVAIFIIILIINLFL